MGASTRLGLIANSAERTRRPTLDELNKLMDHFAKRREGSAPMTAIILFAIFSTRRLSEITRLKRADLEGDRIWVRDMKDPKKKLGNDVLVHLPEPALQLLKERIGGEVLFPYNPHAISASFTQACSFLEIEDLHFHDLRHEGVSHLFELGWTIPQVSAVSGHRSWTSLKRYTQLRRSGNKYKDWKWKPRIDVAAA